ncbi:MAG TPA: N-acetyltransferase [Alphaproteobacteria bacterium]|nr:N-acetyltransferase [Alphaproteobacteria bacterium]
MTTITIPSAEQLADCYALELSYGFENPSAEAEGFFLPGTVYSLYETIALNGYIREIRRDGALAAYVLALPPGDARVSGLLNHVGMTVDPQLKQMIVPDKTLWIAKIATTPAFKRQGMATALYRKVFDDFPGATILTATALSPKRNIVSEDFHKAMDFKKCGTYAGTRADTGETTMNTVWIRR